MNKIRTQQYNYHYILGLASRATLLAFISVTSLGCVHQPQKDIVQEDWVHQVTNYHNSFALDSTYKDILNINQPMRDTVRAKFSKQVKHRAAHSIAKWLIQEDGHGMKYDLSANLTPVEAYQQQRANCLSFTLLLASLAKELDINIQFNSVDIPDTWNLDSDNGLVYYRHINAVLKTPEKTHIYDLAMELYDPGYPQHQITEQQAIAQLYNNLAVDSLGKGELKKAQHLIKTAITLSPENPDLWVNFGVILKRDKQLNMAEKSFKHAFKIDPRSTAAANNLELFYSSQGPIKKALFYKQKSERARKKNPYYQYKAAINHYQKKKYKDALRHAKKAIVLHNKDPRFYELKSLISQKQHNYRSAIKSLKVAIRLSNNPQQRGKYANKSNLLVQRAQNRYNNRKSEINSFILRNQVQNAINY